MTIKQFLIASLCFTFASLGVVFGIAFTLGKFLTPPSALDRFITNYLGAHGPLIVFITLCVIGVNLVFLLSKKIFGQKPEPKKK